MMRIRLGTRGSALAQWQARHVAAALQMQGRDVVVELVEIVSTGDQVTDVPLYDVEGTGFFTATLERALVDRRVDVAVHSCKDLPVTDTEGLTLAAIPPRGPIEDVLVAPNRCRLVQLPPHARIGTCSLRRTAQVRRLRPDLECVMLRGNVPTRIDRVLRGELDAAVLARAGVERLGLGAHISEVFAVDDVMPAPAQGALAVQCRAADDALHDLLSGLAHRDTTRAVTAERALLHELGGGCSVPVGAVAAVDGEHVRLAAAVFSLDGTSALRAVAIDTDPRRVAAHVAKTLRALGAEDVLCAAGPSAPPLARPSLGARS